MNGFQRRREMKMESILEAACKLFSQNEVKAVSIAQIAEKAEVSQVSIYNFFGSKDNLVRLTYFKLMDEIMKDIEELINSELSFKEKFEKMVAISLQSADNLEDSLYESEFIKDPSVQKFLEEYGNNKTIPLLMDLIEQGKKEGHLDSDISTESILMYINSFNGMLQGSLNKKARIDLGKLFFYGLFGAKS